jgi:hypothetical protein
MIAAAAVGCKRMFGGPSHARPTATIRVPESEYLKSVADYPVVHVVPNPREGHSSHTGQRGAATECSNFRLQTKEVKDPVKFFVDRAWCGRPMLGPPRRSHRDLRLSVVCDLNAQRRVHGARRNRSRKASQETTCPRSA